MAVVSSSDLHTNTGIQKLDSYLPSRNYITGYQASRDDIAVFATPANSPSSDYVNTLRWYNHIDARLAPMFSGKGVGVRVEGSTSAGVGAPSTPSASEEPVIADDNDDVVLFGEETEEEKIASKQRAAEAKAAGKKKVIGNSSVLLDVKPWDDETDMVKLEETVKSVKMDGLFWRASKLVAVGKLRIMMSIEDDKVSVDNVIEDHLISVPTNENIQSCDIVSFNKI